MSDMDFNEALTELLAMKERRFLLIADTFHSEDAAKIRRIAELEADYKECYQCCTEETIRANEAQATIEQVGDILEDAPELNPSNYDHEGVCELNAKMIEAYLKVYREVLSL